MFTIEYNTRELLAALNQLAQRSIDHEPAMQTIAAELESITESAFANEQDPTTGMAWQALSDHYLARHPERQEGQILQSSGQLAASIESDADALSAIIGSNKPYAAIHQLGGTSEMAPGPAGIPAREYLGVGDADIPRILQLLQDYLVE